VDSPPIRPNRVRLRESIRAVDLGALGERAVADSGYGSLLPGRAPRKAIAKEIVGC